MPNKMARGIALSLLLAYGNGANAGGPSTPPPQAPDQPGQPIAIEIDAGASLFVDPLWAPGSQGTCRYVTNPSKSDWFIPIETQTEWQSMETDSDNQYSEKYATEQVCCRPGTVAQNVTLCSASTGGPKTAQIVGTDPTDYSVVGGTGSATATCSNQPFGDYAETETFNCILDPSKPSSGVGADGTWSAETSDKNACQDSGYSVPGGCSQSCSTNGSIGHIYETVYNSCGQIVSQGYSGPSCNPQSCCTPSYSYACDGAGNYIRTDTQCGGGSQAVGQCTRQLQTVGGGSCDPGVPDFSPGGYGGPTSSTYDAFFDCGNDSAGNSTWTYYGVTSGPGVNCIVAGQETDVPYIHVVDGVPQYTRNTSAADAMLCEQYEWVPP